MNKREWMLQAALLWIRAGHGGASDEMVTVLSGTYDTIIAVTPETPQEGVWVEHDGDASKAPHHGAIVIAYDRSGTVYHEMSENLVWDHLDCSDDIVRWRYA
jgi:hypothetical protein